MTDWDKKINESYQRVIDTFFDRIKRIINENPDTDIKPSIQRELNRIKRISIDGEIPDKIQELVKDIMK